MRGSDRARDRRESPAEPPGGLGRVIAATAAVLRTHGHRRMELEFRLGRSGPGGAFVAGVSEAHWRRLASALETSRHDGATRSDTVEYVQADGGRYAVPRGNRGESHPAGGAPTESPTESPTGDLAAAEHDEPGRAGRDPAASDGPAPAIKITHKERLHRLDYPAPAPHPWTVRASIALEVVERPPPGASGDPPPHRFRRTKDRTSYRFGPWTVDLTKATSNLPGELDNDDETFEVEVELADATVLFARPLEDVVRWGWGIACDMCALMQGE